MKDPKRRTLNAERRTLKAQRDPAWELNVGEPTIKSYDLEERLMKFASAVIDLSERLPANRAGNHVAGQILRCGTSAYPNHGEAESAESRDDFIHKLRICHKELRETRRWARLIAYRRWCDDDPALGLVPRESEELVRIFTRSIRTADSGRKRAFYSRPAPPQST